ncbi:MAG: DUF2306 domain-containing protein [Crocinitomicaceae bacterium]
MINSLVFAHVFLGGIALLAGAIALASKKGGRFHRLSGKIFFYSLLVSALTAMSLSTMPGHENPFLFTIGIFCVYFILSGYLALRHKNPTVHLLPDQLISLTMLLTGVIMIAFPVIYYGGFNIVMTVFGALGIFLSIQDFRLYRNKERLQKNYLSSHLVKMIAAYISAFTAFVVVNQFLPGIYGWLAPGFVGTFFILFWTRRVAKIQ